MKQGRTLRELAVEIDRQHRAKVDYLAPTSEIELVPDYTESRFVIKNEYGDMSFDITENAHR